MRAGVTLAGRVGGYVAAMLVVYLLAVLTPAGQAIDDRVYPLSGGIDGLAANVFNAVRSAIPVLVTVIAVIVGVWMLLRRRWVEPLIAVVALLATSMFAEGLRDWLLVRPAWGLDGVFYDVGNTYPSRHVAYTLVACIVITRMLPVRSRAWRAASSAVVVAVAVISVAAYAHRWSDVIGGALLAGAIGCCLSRGAPLPWNAVFGGRVWPWWTAGVAIAAGGLLAAVPIEPIALVGLTVGTAVTVGAIAWISLALATADLPSRGATESIH